MRVGCFGKRVPVVRYLLFAIAVTAVVLPSLLVAQDAVRSPSPAQAQGSAAYRSPSELKKLSLEELVDVEITSASRRPERILEAASAIDVLTEEVIHRSGATN